MKKRGNKGLCSLIVLAQLLCQVVPAGAEGIVLGEQEFRIEFDEVLAVDELSFEMDGVAAVDATPTAPMRTAELATIRVRDIRPDPQVSAQQGTDTASPGKIKRTGRWMKKHWWVPTLIGIAVAVWVLEPFDDDDDERQPAPMVQ